MSRSDRIAKYNQLLRIEEELGDAARYPGRTEHLECGGKRSATPFGVAALDALCYRASVRVSANNTSVKPAHSQREREKKTMDLSDIRHLFDYTEWANNLAMDAADNLTDEQLHKISASATLDSGTLTHMAGAEWIWLERWHGRSPAKAEAWSMWTPESCAIWRHSMIAGAG